MASPSLHCPTQRRGGEGPTVPSLLPVQGPVSLSTGVWVPDNGCGGSLGCCGPLPDKLKLDWWRFRMGGGWCLEGEDLAEGAGVAYLGVAGTSYTGPSYMPLGTPCNPET